MYEPYDYKKESKIKKFLNNIREKFIAFKQELHFKDMGPNKWIIVFIPLTLLLLVGLTYTGYVTYTGRVTEAQSKILVMEKQMEGLQSELDKTSAELSQCSSNLDATKSDLASTKASLEQSQKNAEICGLEREDLLTKLDDKQEELDKWIAKYNTLEANYHSLECNFVAFRCTLYYTVKDNNIHCCIKTDDGKFYCGVGIETPAENVKTC